MRHINYKEKDFHNHLAPCEDYNDQRLDGITYCSWKRNPAFTSKHHLIYGALSLDHPFWPPTLLSASDLVTAVAYLNCKAVYTFTTY